MTKNNPFNIPYVGLKNGLHQFTFNITDDFFKNYGIQEFTNADLILKLDFLKNPNLFLLDTQIEGSLLTACDRCCNDLKIEIFNDYKLIVKMVTNPMEMNQQEADPDILYIAFNDSHLNLSDLFYEYIELSIPTIKYCSDFENMQCDEKTLEILKKLSK